MRFAELGGQNWVIKPVAPAFNEQVPKTIQTQRWEINLTGVAIVNAKGGATWIKETIKIYPDMLNPLKFILNKHGVPFPTDSPYIVEGNGIVPVFQLDQWAPYAALGSVFDANAAINAGFAVDFWRPAPFITLSAPKAETLKNIFDGVLVDIAVSDTDASLLRISYHITLIGKIIFVKGVVH